MPLEIDRSVIGQPVGFPRVPDEGFLVLIILRDRHQVTKAQPVLRMRPDDDPQKPALLAGNGVLDKSPTPTFRAFFRGVILHEVLSLIEPSRSVMKTERRMFAVQLFFTPCRVLLPEVRELLAVPVHHHHDLRLALAPLASLVSMNYC